MFPQLLVLRSWLNGIRLIPYPAFPPIVPKLLHYLNNQAHPLKEPPKQSLENKKKKNKSAQQTSAKICGTRSLVRTDLAFNNS